MSFERCSYACLKTARSENGWVFYYVEEITNTHFIVYTGDKFTKLYSIVKGSDATDFNTNFKSAATSVTSDSAAASKINLGVHHIFSGEALASGVYEDSLVVGCDHAHKTFNIENTHGSNALNYKIWGSPNNTDFEEIQGETALAAGAKTSVTNNDFWKFVKVSAEGSGGASEIDCHLQVGP